MNFLRVLVVSITCLVLSAFIVPFTHADTVIYSFNGDKLEPYGNFTDEFQFTTSGFITSSSSVLANQLNECTDCVVSTTLPAAQFLPHNTVGGDVIGFADFYTGENFYVFPAGAFSTPGFYTTLSQSLPGTLIVTDFPSVRTPENGTLALLGTGLLGLIAIAHRKLLVS
jgi:hypothetical protein